MTIEVTSEDIREVSRLLGVEYPSNWNLRSVEQVIAAAWEVMRKKHADTLADAVKESLQSKCSTHISPGGWQAIVNVYCGGRMVQRHVSIDDNFAALATAAVRQLSAQVRQ